LPALLLLVVLTGSGAQGSRPAANAAGGITLRA
jgi:hypothetical protein